MYSINYYALLLALSNWTEQDPASIYVNFEIEAEFKKNFQIFSEGKFLGNISLFDTLALATAWGDIKDPIIISDPADKGFYYWDTTLVFDKTISDTLLARLQLLVNYQLSLNNEISDLSTVATSGSYNDLTDKPTFATVATSGSYNDLIGKPSLASVATSGNYSDLTGKPVLSTVATSGSYNDLTGKPVLAPVATSGSYNDLTGKPTLAPVATSGDYNDLDNTPDLFSGAYNDLTGLPTLAPVAVSGAYNDLTGKPVLAPVATSGVYNDLTGKPNLFSGVYSDLTGKPTLAPVATSGVYADLTGRPTLAPVAVSGAYNDLTGKPVLSTVATSGSYNDLTGKPALFSGAYNDLTGKPTLATVATSGSYNDLSNKPTIVTQLDIDNSIEKLEIAVKDEYPGLFLDSYGKTLVGGILNTEKTEATVTVDSVFGMAAKVTNEDVFTIRSVYLIEPNRYYKVRFASRRTIDSADPLSNAVQYGIQQLSPAMNDNGENIFVTLPMFVADGTSREEYTLSLNSGTDLTLNSTTRYIRPFVRHFGVDATLLIGTLVVTDITDTVAIDADIADIDSQLVTINTSITTISDDLEAETIRAKAAEDIALNSSMLSRAPNARFYRSDNEILAAILDQANYPILRYDDSGAPLLGLSALFERDDVLTNKLILVDEYNNYFSFTEDLSTITSQITALNSSVSTVSTNLTNETIRAKAAEDVALNSSMLSRSPNARFYRSDNEILAAILDQANYPILRYDDSGAPLLGLSALFERDDVLTNKLILVDEYNNYFSFTQDNTVYPDMQVVVSTDIIDIYVRQFATTYTKWRIQHQTYAARKAEVWRTVGVWEATYLSSGLYLQGQEIFSNGEVETAIAFLGRVELIGGITHGGEKLNTFRMHIDGVEKDHTVSAVYTCNQLDMYQSADLYRPGATGEANWPDTPPVKLGDGYKRWTFTKDDGLKLAQHIDWSVGGFTVQHSYFGMVPIRRLLDTVQVTDTAARSPKYLTEDVSTTGFTEVYSTSDTVSVWGDRYSVIANASGGWTNANRNVYIRGDSTAYNKIYFSYHDGITTSPGDAWDVETKIKVFIRS